MSDRVVMLGIDGLDFQRMHKGIEAGRLPHLRNILEKGAHAQVAVKICTPGLSGPEAGMNSPTLWTTVATGQYYFQHGVYDFANAMECVSHPPLFESRHVRSPRLWDVLGTYDVPSVVAGFYVTHPAYPIKGILVSDLFGEVASPDVVCPKDRCDELARLLGAEDYADYMQTLGPVGTEAAVREAQDSRQSNKTLKAVISDILQQFTQLNGADTETLLNDPAQDRVRRIINYRLIYPCVRDDRLHRVFMHLIEHESWRFATCYYRLIDFVSHGFWTTGHDLPAEFATRYGYVVDRAYEWIDICVGQVAKMLDRDDRLLILSDHGFMTNPSTCNLSTSDQVHELSLGQHADPAVLLAFGGARKGPIDNVTLLDIAPTIWDYFGIPQAESLDGGVIPGLLASDSPKKLAPVASYAYSPPTVVAHLSEEEQAAVINRLAALGYLEEQHGD